MPPYSSPFSATTHGDGDLSRSYTTTGRGASTSLGFTSNLMETIAASKSKMEEWARHEKAKADAMAEAYHQHLSQEQAVIDAKSTELLAVQMERGMKLDANDEEASQSTADNIASRKQALEEKASAVQIEIMKLKTEKENRTERVKAITLEEKKQCLRAKEVRDFKMQVEEDKKTTLDDLTQGVVNYKMLGLDFVRTEREGRLRFCYNKLDPNDPSREFSFLLVVTEQEKFDIAECQPQIGALELAQILEDLNDTEDMSTLARRMRKAFKEMSYM